MATQAQPSTHLTMARQLLDELGVSDGGDPQVKATAAVAHAALVLAEQVAAVRLVMSANAVNAVNGKVAAATPPRSA